MEQLWSPWRSAYINGAVSAAGNGHECFLCRCATEQVGLDWLVVARFEHCYVVMNRYPYNAGHLLVAPYGHHGDLGTLDPAVAQEVMVVLQAAIRITGQVLGAHGCNVGANLGRAAGAGVPDHLHLHVVPRWAGDTNFMPVIADIKVISDQMAELHHRFAAAFTREPVIR